MRIWRLRPPTRPATPSFVSTKDDTNDNTIIGYESTIGDDKRIHDLESIDDEVDESERLENEVPCLEEQLRKEWGLRFIRTPWNEIVVITDMKYLGARLVWNKKYQYPYWAHFWSGRFLSYGKLKFKRPKPGILQIPFDRWKEAKLENPSDFFRGQCRIEAWPKSRIVEIITNQGTPDECRIELKDF